MATTLSNPESETYKREYDLLLKLNNNFKKVVITTDNIPPSYDDNGILTINIIDFLLNKQSI